MTTQVQTPAPEAQHGTPAVSGSSLVRLFRDHTAVHVALLTAWIACFNGASYPTGDEMVYLLAAYRQWHPDFLLNDWTYSGAFTAHIVFNYVVGLAMLLAPLEVVAWIGRLACWSLISLGILRLGRRFGIPLALVSISVALWLGINQSIVGAEWILHGLEAKVVSYVLLFFAIDRFLDDRDTSGAVLLGLGISFHAAVGVVAAFAIGIGLLALRRPWPRIARIVGWTGLFALPGILPVVLSAGPDAYGTREIWRFLSLVSMPYHLDPAAFVKRDVLLLGLLLLFNGLYWYGARSDRTFRFLLGFEAALAAVFGFGVLCRATGRYELLQITPFRLLPVFTPLLFFLSWFGLIWKRRNSWAMAPVVVVGTLALLGLRDPVGHTWDRAVWLFTPRPEPRRDLREALRWLRQNTPNGSIAIVPPWAKESYYISRRAQIATWEFPPYDRAEEWRERMEALAGPLEVEGLEAYSASERRTLVRDLVEKNYHERTEAQIAAIVERYGGDYLVSDASYSYPVRFDTGTYRVYRLTPREAAPPPATGRSRPGS